jgi:glycosyltransferase involved in cell wall biosynthesis
VKPGSVDDIVQAIETLSGDQKILESIKHTAYNKLKSHYSNDVLRRNYIALYKEVLR